MCRTGEYRHVMEIDISHDQDLPIARKKKDTMANNLMYLGLAKGMGMFCSIPKDKRRKLDPSRKEKG